MEVHARFGNGIGEEISQMQNVQIQKIMVCFVRLATEKGSCGPKHFALLDKSTV